MDQGWKTSENFVDDFLKCQNWCYELEFSFTQSESTVYSQSVERLLVSHIKCASVLPLKTTHFSFPRNKMFKKALSRAAKKSATGSGGCVLAAVIPTFIVFDTKRKQKSLQQKIWSWSVCIDRLKVAYTVLIKNQLRNKVGDWIFFFFFEWLVK